MFNVTANAGYTGGTTVETVTAISDYGPVVQASSSGGRDLVTCQAREPDWAQVAREVHHAMSTRARLLRSTMLLAGIAVIASCTSLPGASSSPAQTICNGVSSEVGGCTAERHKYTSSTCADVAREWAQVLDRAAVAVLDGPEVVAEQRRSVRLRQALVIASADMNLRIRELRLQEKCDLPEFMAAAEPVFSADLRARVGAALFDGDPIASYEDWLADVQEVARVIDEGE